MNAQSGERYRCSDPNCGCEIQVTSGSRSSHMDFTRGSTDQENIGGAATGETGVGTLRNAETAGISTPGDFGSQGATGEGVFGTSGGNQRSTMSGRLGSTTGALKSGRTGSPAANLEAEDNSSASNDDDARFDATNYDAGLLVSEEEESFSCCCGQPMVKSGTTNLGIGRAAGA
jgi:hypothetical protein